MSSDIVKRLRHWSSIHLGSGDHVESNSTYGAMREAADEIEALRKLHNISNAMWIHAEREIETIRAATIEECAKVADEFAGGQTAIGRAITKRIRTLKEQKEWEITADLIQGSRQK